MNSNLAEESNVVNLHSLKPLKRASKRKKDHPELDIPAQLVDRYISYQQQLKEMETVFKSLQEEVQQEFKRAIVAAEKRGESHTTMTAAGTIGEITITTKNQYSKIDAGESEHLHRAMGATFDQLLDECQEVKLKGDWHEFLDAAFAAGWLEVGEWFDVKNFLTIRKNGLETRAKLRRELGHWPMKMVDDLFAQTQYKPSIRVKLGGAK